MEILAPAGNFAKLKYAIEYGADSVYMGLPDFSLRARVNDFTPAKLKKAIEYVHQHQKKIYVTVNIYAHNQNLAKAEKVLKLLNKLRPDAVIIADPGILSIAKKHIKKIDLHLSTQANVTNWQAAKFWQELGIKRIILARELSLQEISLIHKKVPGLELEGFVHGAMCVSYSGRCLLSSWFNQRSANLGDCSHPCRWEYNLYLEETQRPGVYLPIEEDQHGTYILSSKDLCLINHLDQLAKAGLKHFKIEGRTKSILYLANVVKIYKQAVSIYKSKNTSGNKKLKINRLFRELNKISNREFSTGFYFPGEKTAMQKYDAPYVRPNLEFCGEVLKSKKVKEGFETKIKVHNVLKQGEKVEVILPQGENFKIKLPQLFDLDKKDFVKQVHGGQDKTVIVILNQEIPIYSILRKKI